MADTPDGRPEFTRAAFLKSLAAVGVGTALEFGGAGPTAAAPAAGGASAPTTLSPLDLAFSVKNVHRPFSVLDDRFTVMDERFAARALHHFQVLTPDADRPAPALTAGRGRLTASGEAPTAVLLRSDTVQQAPSAAVVVDIAGFSGTATGENVVQAGLVKDAANYLLGGYDSVSTAITLDACVNGTVTRLMETTAHAVGCLAGAVDAELAAGHTLGQSFTVDEAFLSVNADFSTQGNPDSQVTMSLYRGGPGGTLVASRRITLATDSTWWRLDLDAPAPAGTYYLEQSEPSGTPGWWSSATDGFPDGQAYADGAPVAGDRLFTVSLVDEVTTPASLAFCYTGDSAAVYVRPSEGDWTLTAQATVAPVLDLRPEAVLRQYHNAIGFRSSGGGACTLSRARAGYFGTTGVRDVCIVSFADGTPYIRDGRLYLTGTAPGPTPSNAANHMSVFTLNLSDYGDFETVGHLYFRRDGLVVGDVAGKVVLDPAGGGARVFASTWGTSDKPGEIDVTLSHSAHDVLHGANVLDVAKTIWRGGYDPDPTRIDGKWYMPVAGVTMVVYDNDDFSDPTSFPGQDPGFFEGPRLQKVGGQWYVFYGGVTELRVYDLDLRLIGHLDAPHPNAPQYPAVNPPHLMVTPIPLSGGRTKFILVTFNGRTDPANIGLGELVVMDALPYEDGYEFRPHSGRRLRTT